MVSARPATELDACTVCLEDGHGPYRLPIQKVSALMSLRERCYVPCSPSPVHAGGPYNRGWPLNDVRGSAVEEIEAKKKPDLKTRVLCGAVSSCVIAEAVMMLLGGIVSAVLLRPMESLNRLLLGEALGEAGLKLLNGYALFLCVMLATLACMAVVRPWRPYLKALWTGPSGNRIGMLACGLLFGFACNALCVGVSVLDGSIRLEFTQFSPLGLLAFLFFIFIQSSTEEITSRCFIYQRVYRTYGMWPAVLVSAGSFAVMHLFNDGVSLLPIISIFLIGVLYALMVRYLDSIWLTMGAHTAWNLTQNIIFGLPNSGTPSTWSVFSLVGTQGNGIAYDTAFGVEGSVLAVAIHLACIAVLLWWGRRHDKGQYDIWDGEKRDGWFY